MTALLDFPITSAPAAPVLLVSGESALVPLTLLRLPLSSAADQRCPECAGTGVMFAELDPDELDGAAYALVSCVCQRRPRF